MSDGTQDEERGDADGKRQPDDPDRRVPLLDELGERLIAHFRAVEAREATRKRRRLALRLPRPARPALALALALVLAGAAAAAVTLSLKRSAPLSGRVPPVAGAARAGFGFTEAGSHYRIVFAPVLAAGDAGWRSFVYVGRAGRQGSIGTLGGYPTTAMPLLPGGAYVTTTGTQAGKAIHYVLTGSAVAAVKVGSQTILTRSSRALPGGDRIAVFTAPQSRHLARSPQGSFRPPRGQLAAPVPVRPLHIIPLDRRGEPLASSASGEYASRLPTRVWRRGSSASAERLRSPPPGVPAGACALSRHRLPALKAQQVEVAVELRPVENAVGELLLSCLQATYALHGAQLQAAILLDARRPGRARPGPIPGATPVKGHPGTVDAVLGPTPGDITARRDRSAWLVVEGGHSLAQRLEVLEALRVAKLSPSPHRR